MVVASRRRGVRGGRRTRALHDRGDDAAAARGRSRRRRARRRRALRAGRPIGFGSGAGAEARGRVAPAPAHAGAWRSTSSSCSRPWRRCFGAAGQGDYAAANAAWTPGAPPARARGCRPRASTGARGPRRACAAALGDRDRRRGRSQGVAGHRRRATASQTLDALLRVGSPRSAAATDRLAALPFSVRAGRRCRSLLADLGRARRSACRRAAPAVSSTASGGAQPGAGPHAPRATCAKQSLRVLGSTRSTAGSPAAVARDRASTR